MSFGIDRMRLSLARRLWKRSKWRRWLIWKNTHRRNRVHGNDPVIRMKCKSKSIYHNHNSRIQCPIAWRNPQQGVYVLLWHVSVCQKNPQKSDRKCHHSRFIRSCLKSKWVFTWGMLTFWGGLFGCNVTNLIKARNSKYLAHKGIQARWKGSAG